MTTFDERDKSFENKFAHDDELLFKINARRAKLVGLWAAGLLGKADAEAYAKTVVEGTVGNRSDAALIEYIQAEFAKAGVSVAVKDIRVEMEARLQVARRQILEGQK